MDGGQDKPAWTACPPGVKITRVGGKITRDSLLAVSKNDKSRLQGVVMNPSKEI